MAEEARPLLKQIALVVGCVLVLYVTLAYILAPLIWKRYVRRHPALSDLPGITHTGSGIPGDPINVALIGSEEQLIAIMQAAGWHRAVGLSLRSDLKIAEATVLRRPYEDAPVSNLFLWGRKEDLAFEQPVGKDPRKRHHVRFWKSEITDDEGRPLWAGSVTYDERVGFSHTTGQITHHIGADVDEEREFLFAELEKTGKLASSFYVDDFHKQRTGRNGGGDPWKTDGRLRVGVIAP